MVSSMVVPLRVRGAVIGDIALVAAESGRRFDANDLARAQELADRCALAIDNARLLHVAARDARRPRRDPRGRRRRGDRPGGRRPARLCERGRRPPARASSAEEMLAAAPGKLRATSRCSPRTGSRSPRGASGPARAARRAAGADDRPLPVPRRGGEPLVAHPVDPGARRGGRRPARDQRDRGHHRAQARRARRSGSWPRRAACSPTRSTTGDAAHGRPAGGAGDRRLVRGRPRGRRRRRARRGRARGSGARRAGARDAGALSARPADQYRRLRRAATRDRRAVPGDQRRDARGGRARP